MFGFLKRKSADPAPDSFFSNYTLLNKLGHGGYGVVFTCINKTTGEVRAVKIVHDRKYRRKTWCPRRQMDMPDEILLWERADHPSVVQLCDLFLEQDFWMSVMEYDPEYLDLFKVLLKSGPLSSTVTRVIIRQVIQVTTFLQSVGVDHRDIKDENILYNPSTGHIKLIDFGSASAMTDKSTLHSTFQGTEGYVPPEFYIKGCYQTQPAAVWSIGCLAYTLLKLNPPFLKKGDIIGGKIVEWDFTEDSRARDFVDQCLNYNVNHRISFNSLARHAWFRN